MASPGKRARDNSLDDDSKLQDHMARPSRRTQTLNTSEESHAANDFSRNCTTPCASITDTCEATSTVETGKNKLVNKQKKFLQQWYEDFAQLSVGSSPPDDYVAALAKVIRTQPHLVFEYIDQRHKNALGMRHASTTNDRTQTSSYQPQAPSSHSDSYSLSEANDHLSPTTLNLVEKYVTACRRRRSQNDGRRSVNTGPYRCTFGCGYRTKRVFDWRRHEETHEPQELWLCAICSQKDSQNPFLVNRKDKFLKHINDKHRDWAAEKVLDNSKVDFVPRAELACPSCDTDSGSWDERCRHVLGHFEDEVERGMEKVRIARGDEDEANETVLGGTRSVGSVESGGNERD